MTDSSFKKRFCVPFVSLHYSDSSCEAGMRACFAILVFFFTEIDGQGAVCTLVSRTVSNRAGLLVCKLSEGKLNANPAVRS